MKRRGLGDEHGFTLLEMLVALAIMAGVIALVAPPLLNRIGPAKITTAQTQINMLEQALEFYRLDIGQYPTTDQGLQALREKPITYPPADGWMGPYLARTIPKDPWGREYVYRYPGVHNPSGYDLYSLGPEGLEGDQVIGNW